MAGRQLACPSCAQTFVIPAAQPVADEVTSLPTPPAPKMDQSLVTSTATSEGTRQQDAGGTLPKRRAPVLALAAVFVVLGLIAAAFFFILAIRLARQAGGREPHAHAAHAFAFRPTLRFLASDERARCAVGALALKTAVSRGVVVALPLYVRSDADSGNLAIGCLVLHGAQGRAPRRFAIAGVMSEVIERRAIGRHRLLPDGCLPEAVETPGLAEASARFIPIIPRPPRGRPNLRLVHSRD